MLWEQKWLDRIEEHCRFVWFVTWMLWDWLFHVFYSSWIWILTPCQFYTLILSKDDNLCSTQTRFWAHKSEPSCFGVENTWHFPSISSVSRTLIPHDCFCMSYSAHCDYKYPTGCTVDSGRRAAPFQLHGVVWWQHPCKHHLEKQRWCTHLHGHGPTGHHHSHRTDDKFGWPDALGHSARLCRRLRLCCREWVQLCRG